MPKLFGSLAALGLLVGTASSASAGTLSLTSGVLAISIGALPLITIGQSPDPITGIAVSSGGGSFVEPQGVFQATVLLPTELFTGVPLVSTLNVTATNGSKFITAAGGPRGGTGGPGGLLGNGTVGVLGGLVNLLVPLRAAGGGGVTAVAAAELAVTVTGNLWTTGAVVLTKITSFTTGPSSFAFNTVTYIGSDARTAAHAGTISLVAPLRILTNAAGNVPGLARQTLTFVPEPGTLLLIGSGVAGLALVGSKKMRK